MMESSFARLYTVREVAMEHFIEHDNCPGLSDKIQGAYAIDLDSYQLDELEKNGYTYAESYCMHCYALERFLLVNPVSTQ